MFLSLFHKLDQLSLFSTAELQTLVIEVGGRGNNTEPLNIREVHAPQMKMPDDQNGIYKIAIICLPIWAAALFVARSRAMVMARVFIT